VNNSLNSDIKNWTSDLDFSSPILER